MHISTVEHAMRVDPSVYPQKSHDDAHTRCETEPIECLNPPPPHWLQAEGKRRGKMLAVETLSFLPLVATCTSYFKKMDVLDYQVSHFLYRNAEKCLSRELERAVEGLVY